MSTVGRRLTVRQLLVDCRCSNGDTSTLLRTTESVTTDVDHPRPHGHIRWRHDHRGRISPASNRELAKESELGEASTISSQEPFRQCHPLSWFFRHWWIVHPICEEKEDRPHSREMLLRSSLQTFTILGDDPFGVMFPPIADDCLGCSSVRWAMKTLIQYLRV